MTMKGAKTIEKDLIENIVGVLVVECTKGLDAQQIQSELKDLGVSPIDASKYGFFTAEELLLSKQLSSYITHQKIKNKIIFFPKSSKNTDHLCSLIKNQSNKSKKRSSDYSRTSKKLNIENKNKPPIKKQEKNKSSSIQKPIKKIKTTLTKSYQNLYEIELITKNEAKYSNYIKKEMPKSIYYSKNYSSVFLNQLTKNSDVPDKSDINDSFSTSSFKKDTINEFKDESQRNQKTNNLLEKQINLQKKPILAHNSSNTFTARGQNHKSITSGASNSSNSLLISNKHTYETINTSESSNTSTEATNPISKVESKIIENKTDDDPIYFGVGNKCDANKSAKMDGPSSSANCESKKVDSEKIKSKEIYFRENHELIKHTNDDDDDEDIWKKSIVTCEDSKKYAQRENKKIYHKNKSKVKRIIDGIRITEFNGKLYACYDSINHHILNNEYPDIHSLCFNLQFHIDYRRVFVVYNDDDSIIDFDSIETIISLKSLHDMISILPQQLNKSKFPELEKFIRNHLKDQRQISNDFNFHDKSTDDLNETSSYRDSEITQSSHLNLDSKESQYILECMEKMYNNLSLDSVSTSELSFRNKVIQKLRKIVDLSL